MVTPLFPLFSKAIAKAKKGRPRTHQLDKDTGSESECCLGLPLGSSQGWWSHSQRICSLAYFAQLVEQRWGVDGRKEKDEKGEGVKWFRDTLV